MEDKELQYAVTPSRGPLTHDHMHVIDEDASGGNSVAGEKETQVSTTICDSTSDSVREVVRWVQQLESSIKTTNKGIEDLRTAMVALQTSCAFIQSTVKLIEVVLCSTENVAKLKEDTLNGTNSMNSGMPIIGTDEVVGVNSPCDSGKKRKSHENDNDEDVNTVRLDVSDQEDHSDGKKVCVSLPNMKDQSSFHVTKPELPLSWTQSHSCATLFDKAFDMGIGRSNFKRTANYQPTYGELHTSIAKQLFVTPSPGRNATQCNSVGKSKLVVSASGGSDSAKKPPKSSGKGKAKMSEGRVTSQRAPGSLLPKGIKWKFRPTNDMHLVSIELQVCAYVFHPNRDPGEVLVRSRTTYGTRADFECLCPGNQVTDEIITLVAEKTTWAQKNFNSGTVWTLPPLFTEQLFLGRTLYELMESFSVDWMEPYSKLKYIYVPLKTNFDHWYLIVISLQEEVVYHLDSMLFPEEVAHRRHNISIVCDILSQMVSSSYYGTTFLGRSVQFAQWEVKTPCGIPLCDSSENSAIWILDWMEMEQAFQPNLHTKLQENIVRMRTTMGLLLGLHNELRKSLEEKAMAFWDTLQH